MIEIYLNECGYHIVEPKGSSRYIYDLPSEITNDAAKLYTFRWVVMNAALDEAARMGNEIRQDLIIHTDSRLIEELRGEIQPQSDFAKASLKHYVEYDQIRYRKVHLVKCPTPTIQGRLNEPVSTSRP